MKMMAILSIVFAASHVHAEQLETKERSPGGKPNAAGDTMPATHHNLVEVITASKDHTTFMKLAKDAGVLDALKAARPFTVFAPTDAAFKKISKKEFDALSKDKEKLKSVLNFHVVASTLPLKELMKATSLGTLQGGAVDVKVDGKKIWIGKALVTNANTLASNGVMHSLDHVLLPPVN